MHLFKIISFGSFFCTHDKVWSITLKWNFSFAVFDNRFGIRMWDPDVLYVHRSNPDFIWFGLDPKYCLFFLSSCYVAIWWQPMIHVVSHSLFICVRSRITFYITIGVQHGVVLRLWPLLGYSWHASLPIWQQTFRSMRKKFRISFIDDICFNLVFFFCMIMS